MPRITKQHMQESIVLFADDSLNLLFENFNIDDITETETKKVYKNEWNYTIKISDPSSSVHPEILIKRQNYREGNIQYYNDQLKGNRINETAWIYKEGKNLTIPGRKDIGYKLNGFSIQDYVKTAF